MDEIIKELRARRFEGKLAPHCRAIIAHEDDASSEQLAGQLCQALREEFGGELDFEFGSWAFGRFEDSRELRVATERAAMADLILFSLHAGKALPPPVQEWIEAGLARHRKGGGAVALLVGPAEASGQAGWPIDSYLRHLVERAEMDFWVSTPCETSEPMPHSLDTFLERAGEVTAVLERILEQQQPQRLRGLPQP